MKPSMPHQKYGRILVSLLISPTWKAVHKKHETTAAANVKPTQPSRAIATISISSVGNLLLLLLRRQRVMNRHVKQSKGRYPNGRQMAGISLMPQSAYGQASAIGTP